jgi:hypothetical protein
VEAYLDLVEDNGSLFSPREEMARTEKREGPVEVEAELATMKFGDANGAGVNATHCRVIPSLIRKAWPPDHVANLVIDATMQMAERSGLKWDRAAEERQVNERIAAAYHNLFEKDYDPTTGVIPGWLHGVSHAMGRHSGGRQAANHHAQWLGLARQASERSGRKNQR